MSDVCEKESILMEILKYTGLNYVEREALVLRFISLITSKLEFKLSTEDKFLKSYRDLCLLFDHVLNGCKKSGDIKLNTTVPLEVYYLEYAESDITFLEIFTLKEFIDECSKFLESKRIQGSIPYKISGLNTDHVLLPLPFSDRKNNISTGKLVTRTLDGTRYIEVAGKNSVTNNFTRSDEALANLLTLTGAVSNDTSLQYWGIQYLEYVNTAVTLLNSVDLKKIDSTEYGNMQLAVTALKNSKTPLRKYYELLSGYYTELSNLHEYETLPTEISNLYSAVTSYRDTSNTFISDLKNDFNGDSGFIKQWNKYLDFLKQDNVDITNRNNMRFNTSYYFRAISCMQKLTDTRSIAGTIATADNDSADLIDTLISLVNEQIHRYETENS